MPGILDSIFGAKDEFSNQRSGGILDNPLFTLGLKLAARGGPQKAPHSLAQDLSGAIEDYGAGQDAQTASQLKAMQMKAYRDQMERNRKFREMSDPLLQRFFSGQMGGDGLRTAQGPGTPFGHAGDVPDGPLPTQALQPPSTAPAPPSLAPPSGVSPAFTGSGLAPFPAPGAPNGLPGYNIPGQTGPAPSPAGIPLSAPDTSLSDLGGRWPQIGLAPSSAPSPSPAPMAAPSIAPGLSPDYIQRAGAFESPKGYGVTNSIGARGRYQFKPETYAQYAELAGVDPNDWSPGAQDKVMERWTKANAGKLQMAGLPVNDANLYAMHLLGETKGAKFVEALARDPSQPIGNIVPSSWQAQNPALFRGAKTLRDVQSNIQRKVFGGAPSAQPSLAAPSPGPSPSPDLGAEIQDSAPSGQVPEDLFGEVAQGQEQGPQGTAPSTDSAGGVTASPSQGNEGPRSSVDNATDLLGMPAGVRKQMMFGAMLAAGGDADKFQEILGKSILDYNEKIASREGKFGPIMFVTDGQGNNTAVHENLMTHEMEPAKGLEGLQRQNTLNTQRPFSIDNPDDYQYASDIASYKLNPAVYTRNMTSQRREDIMNVVRQINPDYREGDYKNIMQARGKVFGGPKGDLIRSLNVTTGHVAQLEDLVGKLGNDSFVPLNRIAQIIAHQTGKAAPTNFDTAKEIVVDEIMKSVGGSTMALEDRLQLKELLSKANSPEALYGAMGTVKSLLGGQLNGLRRQLVEFGHIISPSEWDSALFQETKDALKVSLGGEQTMGENAPGTTPKPSATSSTTSSSGAGKVWHINPQTGLPELR